MDSRRSEILANARNMFVLRRMILLVTSLAALLFVFAGTQADAQRARFRYTGGRWSRTRHAGWHRYWGGPSIGFYYAPTPVYVVPGYASPSYYTGPDYWTSNPSFGISLNFGGGGDYYGPNYYSRPRIYRPSYYRPRYDSGRYYGSRPRVYNNTPRYYRGSVGNSSIRNSHIGGGSFGGGHSYGSGRSFGGGHSFGGGRGRR